PIKHSREKWKSVLCRIGVEWGMAAPAADPPAIVRLKNHTNFRRSIRRMVAGAMLSAALKDPISPHEDRNAVPEDELSEVRKRLFRACARGRAGPAGGCGGYGVRLFAGRQRAGSHAGCP